MTSLVALFIVVTTPSLAGLIWIMMRSSEWCARLESESSSGLKSAQDTVASAHPLLTELSAQLAAFDREIISVKSRASSIRLVK